MIFSKKLISVNSAMLSRWSTSDIAANSVKQVEFCKAPQLDYCHKVSADVNLARSTMT